MPLDLNNSGVLGGSGGFVPGSNMITPLQGQPITQAHGEGLSSVSSTQDLMNYANSQLSQMPSMPLLGTGNS